MLHTTLATTPAAAAIPAIFSLFFAFGLNFRFGFAFFSFTAVLFSVAAGSVVSPPDTFVEAQDASSAIAAAEITAAFIIFFISFSYKKSMRKV